MLKIVARNRTKNPLFFRALARVQVILEIFAHNRTENSSCFSCNCTSVGHAENFRTQFAQSSFGFLCSRTEKKNQKFKKKLIKKKNLNHHILCLILVDIL